MPCVWLKLTTPMSEQVKIVQVSDLLTPISIKYSYSEKSNDHTWDLSGQLINEVAVFSAKVVYTTNKKFYEELVTFILLQFEYLTW
jgi:hypothetical protein